MLVPVERERGERGEGRGERERECRRWMEESIWRGLVSKGVLTVMFEPSTSDLSASWWMVDWCMARLGEQGGPYSDV